MGGAGPRRTAAGAADVIRACFTRFSGRRHVVSAAIVRWFQHPRAFRRESRQIQKRTEILNLAVFLPKADSRNVAVAERMSDRGTWS